MADLLLFLALFSGVLGAVSFFWQFYNLYRQRTQHMHRGLSAKVLRPWSAVQLSHPEDLEEPNLLALTIPVTALPPDTLPGQGGREIDLSRLPGLSTGVEYLRRRHPKVHGRWSAITRLLSRYDELRTKRRSLTEPLLRDALAQRFPQHRPGEAAYYSDLDTYSIPQAVRHAEERAIEEAGGDTQLGRAGALGHTFSGDGKKMTYGIRDDRVPLLLSGLVPPSDLQTYAAYFDTSVDTMQEAIRACISRPEVRQVSVDLVECSQALKNELDAFRIALREATLAVDVEG